MPGIFTPFVSPKTTATGHSAATGRLGATGHSADLIRFKIADTLPERKAAFRLVYDAYVGTGLMLPNPYEMRVMPHHLLPTTTVLIAVYRDEVVATVSVIGDGRLGMPIERIYADEVEELRDPSRWLGEVSSLASRHLTEFSRLDVFVNLMRLMAQHARKTGLDHLLAAIHPRHSRFYQRRLGFEPFGAAKPYPAVQNKPAVALLLDFVELEREGHENYGLFFGEPLNESQLAGWPISSAERRFFAPASLEWSNDPPVHVMEAATVGEEAPWTACA